MPIDQCPQGGGIDIRTGIQIAHEAAIGCDEKVHFMFGCGKRVGRPLNWPIGVQKKMKHF